jgi:hypothetical protein
MRMASKSHSFDDFEPASLVHFRTLVEECRRHNTHLIVLISPAHARQWSGIWATGLWPEVERWKQELVKILEEDALQNPDKEPFVLWDFGGYNSVTTEEIPLIGDTTTKMRWYWESSHYKKEVGDMMLERILNYPNPERQLPPDFGLKLASGNIDEHLRTMSEQQRIWHLQHQQDLQEIMDIVKVAQKERSGKEKKV